MYQLQHELRIVRVEADLLRSCMETIREAAREYDAEYGELTQRELAFVVTTIIEAAADRQQTIDVLCRANNELKWEATHLRVRYEAAAEMRAELLREQAEAGLDPPLVNMNSSPTNRQWRAEVKKYRDRAASLATEAVRLAREKK